ncbi:hypothetical protein CDAR_517531 [Caerostris darwini]|uniref:Uncharacterized protein n=1 Tax=Caerostris darwini TaxID=1538125 RepID=A0AAV4PJJ7_9ARAC|nr:hypothetical protein CDAR_517531 [Caerostris darwini]
MSAPRERSHDLPPKRFHPYSPQLLLERGGSVRLRCKSNPIMEWKMKNTWDGVPVHRLNRLLSTSPLPLAPFLEVNYGTITLHREDNIATRSIHKFIT